MLTYDLFVELKNGEWLKEKSIGRTEEDAVENYLDLCGIKSWIVSITEKKTKRVMYTVI